jgi:CrcB protein
MRLPPALAVFIGGSVGGAARLAIDELIPTTGTVPWDIAAINVAGSLALGLLAARLAEMGHRWWTPLVTTGALGGFTTFSAIAALRWTADAPVAVALGALVGITVACVAAAGLGWRLGAATMGRRSIPAADILEEDEL